VRRVAIIASANGITVRTTGIFGLDFKNWNSAFMRVSEPNAPHQRPRASDIQLSTATLSRAGSIYLSMSWFFAISLVADKGLDF
jgi:hypothetical protein